MPVSLQYSTKMWIITILRVLNQATVINHAIPLRLIEYFTDPKIYTNESTEISAFIFNYLIKNKYISQLISYCLTKIPPNMSKQSINIPIAQSICDLFLRIFFYLNPNNVDLKYDVFVVVVQFFNNY